MKKLISVLLSVCIAITAAAVGFVGASAATKIENTDITWNYDSSSKVLKFEGNGAIPDYDDYLNVNGQVELKYPWKGLGYTTITFGEGITGIGNAAFCYSSALKEVTIPDTVTVLGKQIFQGCSALESVKLPAGVATVSENLFANCESLKNVTLSPKTASIGAKAFYKCAALESISLPDGLLSIGASAFHSCISLKSFSSPSTLTAIGEKAFYSCEMLSEVTLNDGLKTIGMNTFDYCTALKSIAFPEGITVIPQAVCSGCSALESVTIPVSVTEIKAEAFNICPSLKSVTLSQNVTAIGEKALGYGRRGNKVEGFTVNGYDGTYAYDFAVENGYKFNSLGFYTSGGCGEKATWNYNNETKTLTITGEGAMADYTAENKPYYMNFNDEIERVVISEGITRVGNYAFYGMGDFEIDISKLQSLTSVGDFAFANTRATFAVGKAVTQIGAKAFGIYDAEGKLTGEFTALQGYKDSYAQKYAAENGLPFEATLNDYVFEGKCGENLEWSFDEELQLLIVSGTGEMTDYTTDKLPEYSVDPYTEVWLDEGITSVGSYAFLCLGLTEIEIPESVEKIGEKAVGYYLAEDGSVKAVDGFTVIGQVGSAAESYATDNGFEFVPTGYIPDDSGVCGDDVSWEYSSGTGFLTISGTGATYDYSLEEPADFYYLDIEAIFVEDGVTELGNMLFLTEKPYKAIMLPDTITKIGDRAIGYYAAQSEKPEIVKNGDVLVTGYTATCADEYAAEHEFEFISLDAIYPQFGFAGDEFFVDHKNATLYSYICDVNAEQFIDGRFAEGVENGAVDAEGLVATGATLSFEIAGESYEYAVVVAGDVNCDGKVNSSDALAILNHSVEQQKLTDEPLLAGDINMDGSVNSTDALSALQVSVGIKKLAEFSPNNK